jgi:hypothetical protein
VEVEMEMEMGIEIHRLARRIDGRVVVDERGCGGPDAA